MARQSVNLQPWAITANDGCERLTGRQAATIRRPPVAPWRHLYGAGVVFLLTSIDKTVLTLLPLMAPLVAASLNLNEATLGIVIGSNLLTVALSALFWGYQSGKRDRRTLLVVGTFCWVVPVALASFSRNFYELLLLFTLAGFGLGSVMPVGYSLIGDMMPSSRRGLLMSVWGVAQGLGAGTAPLLVGLLEPAAAGLSIFALVASLGAVLAILVSFAGAVPGGSAGRDSGPAGARAAEHRPHFDPADFNSLWRRRSNRWLILQGFVGQLAYGAFQWLPGLLTAKLIAEGTPLGVAAATGALLYPITQAGAGLGLLSGYVGDRLQRRSLRARGLLAGAGLWLSVPAYLLFFWLPLPLGGATDARAPWLVIVDEIRHNRYLWATLGAALVASAANAVNAPSWYALVADVNLPEHRGTAFSLVALANSSGRALGGAAAGIAMRLLNGPDAGVLASAEQYATALTLFSLCFIPAGACFFQAARTAPRDIGDVTRILRHRTGIHAEEHDRPC